MKSVPHRKSTRDLLESRPSPLQAAASPPRDGPVGRRAQGDASPVRWPRKRMPGPMDRARWLGYSQHFISLGCVLGWPPARTFACTLSMGGGLSLLSGLYGLPDERLRTTCSSLRGDARLTWNRNSEPPIGGCSRRVAPVAWSWSNPGSVRSPGRPCCGFPRVPHKRSSVSCGPATRSSAFLPPRPDSPRTTSLRSSTSWRACWSWPPAPGPTWCV